MEQGSDRSIELMTELLSAIGKRSINNYLRFGLERELEESRSISLGVNPSSCGSTRPVEILRSSASIRAVGPSVPGSDRPSHPISPRLRFFASITSHRVPCREARPFPTSSRSLASPAAELLRFIRQVRDERAGELAANGVLPASTGKRCLPTSIGGLPSNETVRQRTPSDLSDKSISLRSAAH
jgi:hypothetical protein